MVGTIHNSKSINGIDIQNSKSTCIKFDPNFNLNPPFFRINHKNRKTRPLRATAKSLRLLTPSSMCETWAKAHQWSPFAQRPPLISKTLVTQILWSCGRILNPLPWMFWQKRKVQFQYQVGRLKIQIELIVLLFFIQSKRFPYWHEVIEDFHCFPTFYPVNKNRKKLMQLDLLQGFV